ncbi:MAG: SHOCT domain-containing protein [Bacteroidetes bacterium]|nr:SHOCT domain-containing protein [Bacteroidota bacterium]
MGISKFIGKKISQSATELISGVTEVIIGTAGDIAQNATTKVMNVGTEIHKSQIEKANMSSRMHEDTLIKLKSMLDSDILTQEEFAAKKVEVLSKM